MIRLSPDDSIPCPHCKRLQGKSVKEHFDENLSENEGTNDIVCTYCCKCFELRLVYNSDGEGDAAVSEASYDLNRNTYIDEDEEFEDFYIETEKDWEEMRRKCSQN